MNKGIGTTIGIIAAILTSLGFVPQVRKMWQRKSVGDVSVVTFIQFSVGILMWIIYGFIRQDPIIIIANTVTFLTLSIGLFFYFRYRHQSNKTI